MSMNELSSSITGGSGFDATERVLKVLRERGALSSADIARLSGLAKSTVSGAVAKLRDAGVIAESSRPRAKGSQTGRPATLLTLNPRVGGVVGIMMDIDEIRAVLADVSHAVLARRAVRVGADYTLEEGLAAIEQVVADVTEAVGFTAKQIFGAGVAVPGPVHPVTGRVGRSNMIPNWRGVHIGEAFANRLSMPVFADNESNCSALGELMWGAARGFSNVVYIKLDVGVGGAVIVDGKIVRGVAGGAGEFGHMTYRSDGPLCRCGNRGCFHMYCSTLALLDQLRPQYGAEFTAAEMIAAAIGGDVGCARVIADAGTIAGEAIALACNALNPERVVVGGKLPAAGEVLFTPLKRSFNRHSLLLQEGTDPDATTSIVAGTEHGYDPALGAIGLALRQLGENRGREALSASPYA
jgi:predicted NBD/HSP70 family sugar kinase